ncbi:alpha/beta hydrolase [Cryobacterium fucosi]|uniref:Alpha/beta hydrolase n=1 Tax=Cryobacterium fucosi TaxID=1259157 RepID=A0A4R9BAB6_9MICO|nr:alpha/beta hydrolase [Cryobacterium fucosi]TFD79470.1 alpha/beta hydrolase [Cryobacterium fucosi]
MNSRLPHTRFGTRRARLLTVLTVFAVALVGTAGLAGLQSGTTVPDSTIAASKGTAVGAASKPMVGIRTFARPAGLTVTTDVVYTTQADGTPLALDVCSPAGSTPGTAAGSTPGTAAASALPAVVSIHGGSWTRGDKANDDWRDVCEWLASEGFVAYSVDYRLAPASVFPGAIDDLATAVEWIRRPENVARFGIDPARIGAFGGSAGANLALLLGTRGTGSLTEGSRVAAVAELSGPTDLTGQALATDGASERLQDLVLRYLGCTSLADCPQAVAASPTRRLDRTDPPVFIGQSDHEFIPLAQATRFATNLDRLGIKHELVTVPGAVHSIGILDVEMRARVAAFLHATLGH